MGSVRLALDTSTVTTSCSIFGAPTTLIVTGPVTVIVKKGVKGLELTHSS